MKMKIKTKHCIAIGNYLKAHHDMLFNSFEYKGRIAEADVVLELKQIKKWVKILGFMPMDEVKVMKINPGVPISGWIPKQKTKGDL